VKLAVGLGADLNGVNHAGETALHRGASRRLESIIQFLAESGALNLKNTRGQTPLALAMTEVVPDGAFDIGSFPVGDDRCKRAADLLRRLGAKE